MSDYPMLISNKLHSFRNFYQQIYNYYHKADMFDKLFIKDFTIYVNNKNRI